eukprot:TRINITY_DN20870_c0_g1_i1.p1 TRINITY_DN20870_c0_g1~~TRINITY_DN20870_c0_g1_i1.p1  ORF type:complete len:2012 (-),score=427.80 TRINITY_DN20870_c0_g1_i1:140-6175(-)
MPPAYPSAVAQEPIAAGGQIPWMRGWTTPPLGAPTTPTRQLVPATATVSVGGGGCGSPMPPPPSGVTIPSAAVLPPNSVAADVFNQLDRNHDGVITREEWNRAMAMSQAQQSSAVPQAPQTVNLSTATCLRQPSPAPRVSIAVPQALTATQIRVPSTTYLNTTTSAAYVQNPNVRQQSPSRPIVTTVGASANVLVWQVSVPVQKVQPTATTLRPAEVSTQPASSVALLPYHRVSEGSKNERQVSVPEGLLTRIDGVVSEMERELSEDLVMCVNAPLRDAKRKSNEAIASRGEGETTIDWLDKQIWAIEQRREACEMRQSHLGELRRIVAEGNTWPGTEKRDGTDDSGAYTAESGGSRNLSTVLGGSEEDEGHGGVDDEDAEDESARPREANSAAVARKMAMLETENDLLRRKVEGLESMRMQQAQALSLSTRERDDLLRMREKLETECENRLTELRSVAEAVESGERRAEIAEQAANERVVQAAREAQALQAQLLEVEATVSRERHASSLALETQASTEADLRTLEENSRAVLSDCRALQAKVRELEAERTTFADVQVSFEEERRALNHRVRMLEEQRGELENFRQELADENLNLSRQHKNHLHTRDEQSIHELTALKNRERMLTEELAEKHAALISSESTRRFDEEAHDRALTDARTETMAAHHSVRNADRARIAELERELMDARGAAVALEASVQRFSADRARIVELEQELAEALGMQESQGRQIAQYRARTAELEQTLADAQSLAENHARQLGVHKASVASLDQQLREAVEQRESYSQQHHGHRQRVAELEQHVITAKQAEEHYVRQINLLQGKHAELELHLNDVVTSKDHHAKNSSGLQIRIAEIEAELQEAASARDLQNRHHTLLKAKNAELEDQLTEHLAMQSAHTKTHADLKRSIALLEGQLGDLTVQHESLTKHHSSVKSRHVDLERHVDERQNEIVALKEASAKSQTALKRRIDEIEKELQDEICEKERHLRHHQGENQRVKLQLSMAERALEEATRVKGSLEATVEEKGRHHTTLNERIAELEEKLTSALREKDIHSSAAQARVCEIEAELEIALHDKERHSARHGHATTRLEQIEAQLAEALAEQGEHVNHRHTSEAERKRLQVLLEAALQEKDEHINGNELLRARMVALEGQLASVFEERDSITNGRQDLVSELTAVLEEKEILERKHAEMEQRSAHYELQLANADDVHTRNHSESKDRVIELERHVHEALIARDEAAKGYEDVRVRFVELERELAEVADARDHHQDMHSRLKMSMSEIERKLGEADALREQQVEEHLMRIVELENLLQTSQLVEARIKEDSEQLRDASSRQIEMLEDQLGEEQQAHLYTKQQAAIADRENHDSSVRELQYQVATLQAELTQAREAFDLSREELERARIFGETVEQDAEAALTKADEVRTRHEKEWNERLEQAHEVEKGLRARIQELERQVSASHETFRGRESLRSDGIMSSHSSTHDPPTRLRSRSLTNTEDVMRALEPFASGERSVAHSKSAITFTPREVYDLVLPGSTDPFVMRVQDAQRNTQDMLRSVGELHNELIEAQLLAVASKPGHKNIHDVLSDYDKKQEIELQRRLKANTIDSVIHDLQSLREEARTQHHLSPSESEEIDERIRTDLQRCHDESTLLRSTSVLAELPEPFVETLVDIHKGASVHREWKEGFSPLHWSAQNGRRDIIDYLIRREGGQSLVRHRDKLGRTPLYYADSSRKRAVSDFLRHEVGGGEVAPLEIAERRPSGTNWDIPESYRTVLDQIEAQGWHTVKWKNGYTMLHWAASKGHTDLCTYLVQLDADPNEEDNQGKTPLSCALEADHEDCGRIIQELCGKPRIGSELPVPQQILDRAASTVSPSPARALPAHSARASFFDSGSRPRKQIPDAYIKVMEQIDRIGWDKMHWARGFTLLHWAAKHDVPDLVARFMAQGGDPHQKDEAGKDAFDYARERGSKSAEMQLRMPPPDTVPPLSSHIPQESSKVTRHQSMIANRMSVVAGMKPSFLQSLPATAE